MMLPLCLVGIHSWVFGFVAFFFIGLLYIAQSCIAEAGSHRKVLNQEGREGGRKIEGWLNRGTEGGK